MIFLNIGSNLYREMALTGKYADLLHLIGKFSVGIVAEFAQLKERFITHDKEIATLRASIATLESAHNKLVERCKMVEEANATLREKVAQLEQCVIISDASANCAKECAIIERAIEEFIMRLPRTPYSQGRPYHITLDSLESRQFAIYKTILHIRANPGQYMGICTQGYGEHYIDLRAFHFFAFERKRATPSEYSDTQIYNPLWDEIATKYKLNEVCTQYQKFRI